MLDTWSDPLNYYTLRIVLTRAIGLRLLHGPRGLLGLAKGTSIPWPICSARGKSYWVWLRAPVFHGRSVLLGGSHIGFG